MAERAKIVVHPTGADSDLLPVREALSHILDFLALLNHAESARVGETKIVWLLEKITSNSPIAADMIGAGVNPVAIVSPEVSATMETLAAAIDAAIEGKEIPHWLVNGAYETAERFFKRNTGIVGRTDITLNGADAPTYIPSAKANDALINLQQARLTEQKKVRDHTHTAYGAVEGIVTTAGKHYNTRPAMWIRERKSGNEVRCVFDADTAQRIGERFNIDAAWKNVHVIVEGAISYGKTGEIEQVAGIDVVQVTDGKTLDISDFADPTFTGGLDPGEYLDLWRERGRG